MKNYNRIFFDRQSYLKQSVQCQKKFLKIMIYTKNSLYKNILFAKYKMDNDESVAHKYMD